VIEIVRRLLASTIGALIARESRRLLRMVACGVAAAVFLTGAIAFLIIAGYLQLRLYFPATEAALLTAGGLIILAALCLLPVLLSRRRRQPVTRTAVAADVAPFADILEAAGLLREAATLRAGAQAASQVKPYYLVAAAVIVGLILSRKLRRGAGTEKSRRP
jgi:hypothetical protein